MNGNERESGKRETPERLIRVMTGQPEIDIERRVVYAQFTTRKLARDGGIVDPAGIVTKFYEANPVVLAQHGMSNDARSPVIARSLGLGNTRLGMESETQFAETDLAREYAYLYGVNTKREVYMRGWSFGWESLEVSWLTNAEARKYLGSDWDEEIGGRFREVWLSKKSEMHEYSAVAVGSDRAALSRAHADGVRVAGEIIVEQDLSKALRMLDEMRGDNNNMRSRIENLEKDIQAVRGEGAAAATHGDSAEILARVDAIFALTKGGTK